MSLYVFFFNFHLFAFALQIRSEFNCLITKMNSKDIFVQFYEQIQQVTTFSFKLVYNKSHISFRFSNSKINRRDFKCRFRCVNSASKRARINKEGMNSDIFE